MAPPASVLADRSNTHSHREAGSLASAKSSKGKFNNVKKVKIDYSVIRIYVETVLKSDACVDQWFDCEHVAKLLNLEYGLFAAVKFSGNHVAKATGIGKRSSIVVDQSLRAHQLTVKIDGKSTRANVVGFISSSESEPSNDWYHEYRSTFVSLLEDTDFDTEKVKVSDLINACTSSEIECIDVAQRCNIDDESKAECYKKVNQILIDEYKIRAAKPPNISLPPTNDVSERVFKGRQNHDDVVKILKRMAKNPKTWWKRVKGCDDIEIRALVTTEMVFEIGQLSNLMYYAAKMALEVPLVRTWESICDETVRTIGGTRRIGCSRSLQRQFVYFLRNDNQLYHPCRLVNDDGVPVETEAYLLLSAHPTVEMTFTSWCRSNLGRLNVDTAHHFIATEIIPAIRKELEDDLEGIHGPDWVENLVDSDKKARGTDCDDEFDGIANDDEDLDPPRSPSEILIDARMQKLYGVKNGTISRTTAWRWMKALGMTYEARTKTYFVDNHEDPKVVEYRNKFVREYLELELQMDVWIQITADDVTRLQEEKKLAPGNIGHRYEEGGVEMVELHVDTCQEFQDEMNRTTEFGGKPSVRRDPSRRQVIIVGQDEVIMKKETFSGKAWKLGDGTAHLVPKTEGPGVMYSGLQSRAIGFALGLTEAQLAEVNEYRRGKRYADVAAAGEVLQSANKEDTPLTTDPGLREFHYGNGDGKQGYWDYNHMVVQLEDFHDCMTVLYPDHDVVYLFDHSSGHCKGREDGLNVNKMNKGWGGKQSRLRPTVITEGCLGEFNPTLKVGDTQYPVFRECDEGPDDLSEEERRQRKHDRVVPNEFTRRELRKDELVPLLEARGIDSKGKKADVVERCKKATPPIPTTISEPKVVPGWFDAAKGLKIMLGERGLIDPTVTYSIDATKDANGNVDESKSLRAILAKCTDFQNELTQLQHIAQKIGAKVLLTPKCHPELAGEGIEYSWGFAKRRYRRDWTRQDDSKRTVDDFLDLTRACLSNCEAGGALTKVRVRKMAGRARSYIVAYAKMAEDKPVDEADPLTYALIEKMAKQYRAHRSALDFDLKFIKDLEKRNRRRQERDADAVAINGGNELDGSDDQGRRVQPRTMPA